MTERTCTVDGCERKPLARGLCKAHYERARRTGEPGPSDIGPPTRPDRQPTVGCSVDGCDRPHKTNGFCSMHYQRWRKWGDPLFVGEQLGASHSQWKGDDITYLAAHHRVQRLAGPATDHPCRHCGDPAHEWAYDHADPDEIRRPDGRWAGLAYSADPTHYMPLCRPCHRQFDREHLPLT